MPPTAIRYDWPSIQLLWTAGASAADISNSLTQHCPEHYDIARNTIAKRAQRHKWSKVAEEAKSLVSANPSAIYNKQTDLSATVLATALNIALEKKNSYIECVSGFVDKASAKLQEREIDSLEDAAQAGKLFQPVHELACDIHGLNAKEPFAGIEVNFLSDRSQYVVTQVEESE